MPTLTAGDIEGAMALVLRALPGLEASFQPPFPAWRTPPEPGAVPYERLTGAVRDALPEAKRKRVFHLTRAACDRLAQKAEVELFFKSKTHKGQRRDLIQWVRLPGKRKGQVYDLPQAPSHRPEKSRKWVRRSALAHCTSPEVTAPIEALMLELLARPISDSEFLATSNGALPPGGMGSGYYPYYYLTTRVSAALSLPKERKANLLGLSVRRLHERGQVELLSGRAFPSLKARKLMFRVRWVRLARTRQHPVICFAPCPGRCRCCDGRMLIMSI